MAAVVQPPVNTVCKIQFHEAETVEVYGNILIYKITAVYSHLITDIAKMQTDGLQYPS